MFFSLLFCKYYFSCQAGCSPSNAVSFLQVGRSFSTRFCKWMLKMWGLTWLYHVGWYTTLGRLFLRRQKWHCVHCVSDFPSKGWFSCTCLNTVVTLLVMAIKRREWNALKVGNAEDVGRKHYCRTVMSLMICRRGLRCLLGSRGSQWTLFAEERNRYTALAGNSLLSQNTGGMGAICVCLLPWERHILFSRHSPRWPSALWLLSSVLWL